MTKINTLNKHRAHIRYKNLEGKVVPGATTILGIMAKPALIKWANNLGLQGIDSTSYVDSMATIGTLAHYMIECYLKKQEADLTEYSPAEISLAENAALKFYEWEKSHTYELIGSEMPLVSEKYQYGGTIDIYWKLDGKYTLTDLKTCKGIYSEQHTQLASYRQLLVENGYPVEECNILRIGRDENEGFDFINSKNLDQHFDRFKHCRAIYDLNKALA